MARVITAWMRHGIYEQPEGVPSAHLPHPLTEQGHEQAREGAATLLDFARTHGLRVVPVIDTSSLLRAWQTADTVAATWRDEVGPTELAQTPDLAERGVGAAANLSKDQIEAIVARDPRLPDLPPGWRRNGRLTLPFLGAESVCEAGERVRDRIQSRAAELAAEPEDVLKVFVGHGGSFRWAAIHMGLMKEADVGGLSMHHCRPVFMERLGPERWTHVGGAWKIRTKTAQAGWTEPND